MLYPLSYEGRGRGMEKTRRETVSICAAVKSSCVDQRAWAVAGGQDAGTGRFFDTSSASDSVTVARNNCC